MSQNTPPISHALEPEEPVAGPSAVPIWLVVLLGLLLYWGLNYLDGHGGSFNAQVYEPFTSYQEVVLCQPHNPEGDYLALGESVFNKSCVLCHQANGAGKEGQFPPLAGSDWLTAAGPNRMVRIVLNGLGGSIRVEGGPNGPVALNAVMAPLGGTYNDEEVGAALTYVRQQWGNKAAKITPDQVKTIRQAIKTHPGPFTPEELLQIPLQ
jgi:mono/diheme cytochrome c family protein